MISARIVLVVVLTCLLVALAATALVFLNVAWARYVDYVVIPIGAFVGIVGAIAASFGRIKNDVR